MRQNLILAVALTACVVATAVVLENRRVPVVHAQASGCTLATWSGAYGYNLNGYVYDNQGYLYFLGAAGRMVSDGNGNVTGADTLSFDGTVGTRQLTGTYTINNDCTGSLTFTSTGGMVTNTNIVLVNNANEINLVETDANWILTGTLKKQDQTVQAPPSTSATQ